MRTTTREFVAEIRKHITKECLLQETHMEEELQNVIDEFNNWWKGSEQKRTPNKYDAFKEFMLCLPSNFNIEFEYHAIHETLKSWFENCGKEYRERTADKEAETYYYLVTREFDALCRKHDIEF